MQVDVSSFVSGTFVGLFVAGAVWRACRYRGAKVTYMGEAADERIKEFHEAAKKLRYVPTWYLAGGVMQTATADFPVVGEVKYEREYLHLEKVSFADSEKYQCCPEEVPEGIVTLDWLKTDNKGPIVVVVPGLTGESSSAYVKRIVRELSLAPEQYQPVVFNPRGRGGVKLVSPFLYSCGYTHDFRRALQHIKKQRPGEKILGVGFSMGANYLAKYMGEEKGKSLIEGACCLAGPVDCPGLMTNLTSGMLGKYFFDPVLTRSLHRVRETVGEIFDKVPHPGVDMNLLKEANTLWKFDDRVTAPTMGCKDADDYYDQSSCKHVLHDISHPTLFMHAENDPIVPAKCLPYESFKRNPHLISLVTVSGGHSMDWPTGHTMYPWSSTVVIEFFKRTQGDRKADQ